MPPFSVRRDIQIKFGIDRRHIYDFFHSRGLRCLNERAVRNNSVDVSISSEGIILLAYTFIGYRRNFQDPLETPRHFQAIQNRGSAEPPSQRQKLHPLNVTTLQKNQKVGNDDWNVGCLQ
ncbi:hypothetical protein EI94DRAFT_1717162 [Lactarius quietus]|nr:hypothetical protein EI94DRAFT_1717162 [Lactarius quietus]